MAIIKNPFRKQDENARPPPTPLAGEKPTSSGSSRPSDLESRETVEYKLSEINDSGVFIPPSPTEKKSFWGGTTSSRSTTSSSLHKCAFNENEQFNISRESFDSYRRSFDISARSPVVQAESRPPRASLDSRTFLPPPRMSNSFHRPLQVPQTQEEDNFEDVNIDDPKPQPQKKRGIFARMVDGVGDHSNRPNSSSENKSGAWHNLTSRKRGDSGRGAELGAMPRTIETPRREQTPKPEKQSPMQAQPQPQPQQMESQATEGAQAPPQIKVDS
ncbi:hypothetical protein Slin15195_G008160 [Septoria linicola]|uniref:Uncharacterized protein n=1 Tax=Septoria linicola TaxID=215465 RepID=A0A9Q9AEG7_9PEZI|nr:hypothetical protein Slin14017_G008170 [Septoria linicola]USW47497.1 hypothetical protein Slin15195_G008160 [Septoria linicola]